MSEQAQIDSLQAQLQRAQAQSREDRLARLEAERQRDELAAQLYRITEHAKHCGMDDPETSIMAMILSRGPEANLSGLIAEKKAEAIGDVYRELPGDLMCQDMVNWLSKKATEYICQPKESTQ